MEHLFTVFLLAGLHCLEQTSLSLLMFGHRLPRSQQGRVLLLFEHFAQRYKQDDLIYKTTVRNIIDNIYIYIHTNYTSYHVMSYHIISYFLIILYYTILCYIIFYCDVLYYIILYYIILY